MKKYVKPEMEITEFDTEDVIMTSSFDSEETNNETNTGESSS